MSSRPVACAVLAWLACLAGAPAARADLAGDAARVARAWAQRGAQVERLAPIFLDHGRAQRVVLPVTGEPRCLTLALLVPRTAEILVGPVEDAAGPLARALLPLLPRDQAEEPPRRRSAAGVVALARCGAARAELARVAVELVAARAAVELVVARLDAPLGELRAILPERAAGPLAARGDAGGPLEPGPLAERVARADRRARGDGAAQVTRTPSRAGPDGAGQAELDLAAGCHRVDVMAEAPASFPHRATDVDAEAHDAAGRLLARDHADVPDARLDFCLGEAGAVTVAYVGAAGAVPVVLADARWPLPPHLPAAWGPRARAGFAAALSRRRAPDPRGEPIFEAQGAPGPTSIPFAVVPGRCYLAALAVLRGEVRSIRLDARVGDRVAHDAAAERPEGVALSFCAEGEAVARFDADVRGTQPGWALAIWPMGTASP